MAHRQTRLLPANTGKVDTWEIEMKGFSMQKWDKTALSAPTKVTTEFRPLDTSKREFAHLAIQDHSVRNRSQKKCDTTK